MLNFFRLLILLACAAGCYFSPSAQAASRNLAVQAKVGQQKRVALVIGNSAYQGIPALKNPVNDAAAMADALNRLGFEVIEVTDATQREMNLAIASFGQKLSADTVALFFYAGHGLQVKGKNYLVPVDAQINSEAEVRAVTVDMDAVMDQLSASTVGIVVLDACRNNPFEHAFRKIGGGLAQMDAPKGSFIAYATAPGKTAADGSGNHGLFTQELLKEINTPGLSLDDVFMRVRSNVANATADQQVPWDSSSMTGHFYFRPDGEAGSATYEPPPVHVKTADEIEDETWEAAKENKSEAALREYMKEYPTGRYTAQARVLIATLGPELATVKINNAGMLVAPGNRKHNYSLTPIDARQFSKGTIKIEIVVGSGESSASFDLFADGMPVPQTGPTRSLAHSYDMSPGGNATLTYTFNNGQLFYLGAEGNWFSPEGSTNTYNFAVTISGELKR